MPAHQARPRCKPLRSRLKLQITTLYDYPTLSPWSRLAKRFFATRVLESRILRIPGKPSLACLSGLIVIGGSYAAAQIATAARKYGYDAPIRVLSDEDTLPYQRPPLSKAFLTGGEGENTLPLRAQALYESQRIDVELGVRVAAIDRSDKFVSSREGRRYSYDRLALAVGARARLLEVAGSDLDGVFTLRTLADARKIKRWLVGAETVAVIGAGFIGLEVASAAVQLGKRVLVLEAVERALARSCPQVMSDWIARLHAAHGVKMLFSAQVASLKGEGGHVRAVVLRDGSEQPADLVIIGIGAVPNIELAKNCGLRMQWWHRSRSLCAHKRSGDRRCGGLLSLSQPVCRRTGASGVGPERDRSVPLGGSFGSGT